MVALHGRKKGKLWQLEAIRGTAALYVFAYHTNCFDGTMFQYMFSFGPEAVIAFFLLSGFVISYSCEDLLSCRKSLSEYFLNRFIRIYPTFVFALLITYFLDCFRSGSVLPLDLKQLLGNLLMTQDLAWMKRGAVIDTFGSNAPLWSLSYEWWFYIAFGLVFVFVPIAKQGLSAFLIALAASVSYWFVPSPVGLIYGYFFIWWSGVSLAREFSNTGQISFANQREMIIGQIIIAAVWSIPVIAEVLADRKIAIGLEPAIQLRHCLAGVVFAIAAIFYFHHRSTAVEQITKCFLIFAPISYSLYVFHMPFVELAKQLPPWGAIALYLFALLPLCYLTEMVVQPLFNKAKASR